MKLALAALLLLLGGAVRADDGEPSAAPEGVAVDPDQTEAVADMSRRLSGDSGLQSALVDRIMRSKISDAISGDLDEKKKRAAVAEWVRVDPTSAAQIALGLERDAQNGTSLFENTAVKHMRQTYRRNNSNRGAFGVLKGAAKTSKLIGLPDQQAGEEERREILRTLFEGKGAQGGKVITGRAPEGKEAGSETSAASPALANSFYDRLSAGNIRGYSPQLMAMQSALNLRRPPGAPKLIETGKLDYATLSYPSYGVKYDLSNLEDRLRRGRIAALATLAGVRLTPRDMQDPGLEERLLKKVPAGKLPAGFAERAAGIARVHRALAEFEAAAARAKNPAAITKSLLVELSARQREAARWLTVASLEEELARIESEEGFLTPDLLAAIDAAPAPEPVRASYKRRGESYVERLAALKANAQASLDALRSDDWLSKVAAIEKAMSESRGLRRNLSRDIADYRVVPFRLAEAVLRQPRWREYLDDLLVKYAQSTSYGRAVAARRGKLARFLTIFGQIASGDLDLAHQSLANAVR